MWFSNPSDFTFVFKSAICVLQTVTGDAVVIYRCYKVWQDMRIIIFPIIMLCGVITTDADSTWACSQAQPSGARIFAKQTGQWITAFYSSTLSTNFICTVLLAARIWQMNSRVTWKVPAAARSSLMPVVFIIVDAGVLYSAALICFVSKSNGQYVVLDMMPAQIMPIISIAFDMVIVRAGIAEASGSTSRWRRVVREREPQPPKYAKRRELRHASTRGTYHPAYRKPTGPPVESEMDPRYP
ncbi:hypothetical protein EVG20_g31 [Dentipellis fragilis]|uniref:Uncharacterized protein n=1 Tax=Dentipellis fragilis TaxID=205917 RepID=A0A4Y9ZDX9_9AGAM|nr:hypothetical protein EVG20_g31 [Dentipellis fragilis]